MTTWADIQRLASDLQRVQLANAAQKLSEQNCIEVVSKLIESRVIDVVYTRDGSAYITKKHLCTMVCNEVTASGGRLPLVDIASNINVHLENVEGVLGRINQDGQYIYTNGELISKEYILQLHSQLRHLLSECGLRSISFLSRHWNLPSDTLLQLITPLPYELNAVIDGEQIYTNVYMKAQKNRIRAIFAGLTKATLLSSIITRSNLPVTRFNALLDELISEKEIYGRFSGSRSSSSTLFIPSVHDRLVEGYIKGYLLQNEYIGTSMFRKLTLGDPKTALINMIGTEKTKELHILSSLVCTDSVMERVKNIVNDELVVKGVSDVSVVQSEFDIPFGIEDIRGIMKEMAKKDKKLTVEGDLIFSSEMITKALKELKISNRLNEKAKEWVDKRLDKKGGKKEDKESIAPSQGKKGATVVVENDDDDWDDKGKKGKGKKGGKGGGDKGGKGGKSTVSNVNKDKEEERTSQPHISHEEIIEWLENVPEQLRGIVADKIHPEIESCLSMEVHQILSSREAEAMQSTKKAHAQMRTNASLQYQRIRLLQEATNSDMLSESLKSDLRPHLLKTLCTELANNLLHYVSSTPSGSTLTPKQRDDTIASLPSSSRSSFTSLMNSLKEPTLDLFYEALQQVCHRTVCDLPLNNLDKEAKDSLQQSYISVLEEECQSETPAASLLSLILLLYAKNGVFIHASGKFAAQLIQSAKSLVDGDTFDLLEDGQRLVILSLKKKGDELEETVKELNDKIDLLKSKILNH